MTNSHLLRAEEIVSLSKEHTFFDWMPQGALFPPLAVVGAKGCEFWTADQTRYLDFSSQLWCVNAGHGREEIVEAICEQLRTLPFANPFLTHEARALLGAKLAQILPGDLNKVFFTLGGAESNEHAVKIARMVTGRSKILARYRSYHGSTLGAVSLTGDPRRWAGEPGLVGVVRIADFHRWGKRDPERTDELLTQLEDVIRFEGAHTIAAAIVEPIVGANGVLIPPSGYLEGMRTICDKHNILLIADEVMTGFGRTGKWFGVDHWGIVPDILTMSKGLTSGYIPLGAVTVRDSIAEYFQTKPFMTGLTYNSHPVSCRAALATIDLYQREQLIEASALRGKLLSQKLLTMQLTHRCVGAVRNIGLFGVVELVKSNEPYIPLCEYNSTAPVMEFIRSELLARRLYLFHRWNMLFINPPLCISEEELLLGLESIDEVLSIVDERI